MFSLATLAANPWVWIAVAVLWVGSVVGAAHWYADTRVTAIQAEHLKRDNAELATANATILRVTAERDTERKAHDTSIAKIGATHATEKAAIEAQRVLDVAAARAGGGKRLRDPGARACPPSDPVPDVAGAAPRGDAPAPGELSDAAREFLYQLAADADLTVVDLTAAQAVILDDRKTLAAP